MWRSSPPRTPSSWLSPWLSLSLSLLLACHVKGTPQVAAGTVPLSETSAAASRLAIPSPAQLRWASDGFGAFVHYNMGTYVSDGGGCNVKDLRRDPRQARLM